MNLPLLLTTFLFLLFSSVSEAGNVTKGGACSQGASKLQVGTYQFYSQCDLHTFCNSSGLCQLKGCRRAEYPVGWAVNDHGLPNRCPKGFFCPDEEDACQPLLPVDSDCQLNRDDQCEPPPDYKELADTTNHGLNVNGSVCLKYKCMWANATLNSACIVENTPYISYGAYNEYIDIVSRDNCRLGMYCDTQQQKCLANKVLGQSCSADKECISYNCLAQGVCGQDALAPRHLAIWVYILVGLGIFGGMFATLVSMFMLHGKQREVEREKRMQYWREQAGFRQSILQMRDTTRQSVMTYSGTDSPRSSTLYQPRERDGSSEDSHTPLQLTAGKASGLRKLMRDRDTPTPQIRVYNDRF